MRLNLDMHVAPVQCPQQLPRSLHHGHCLIAEPFRCSLQCVFIGCKDYRLWRMYGSHLDVSLVLMTGVMHIGVLRSALLVDG